MKKLILLLLIIGGLYSCATSFQHTIEDQESDREYQLVEEMYIFELVATGSPANVRKAIRNVRDVNQLSPEGYTYLGIAAAENPDSNVIRILINAGADVNKTDGNGNTPLMYAAAFNKNPQVLKTLINAGAEVRKRSGGYSPLYLAIYNNQSAEHIRLLMKAGANPNTDVHSPLVLAAEYNQDPGVFKALVDAGAEVNVTTDHGYTPLMRAARDVEDPEVVRILVEAGAELDRANTYNTQTALFDAIYSNNTEKVRIMLDSGADPNFRSPYSASGDGYMPLTYALSLETQNPNVIRALVDAGSLVDVIDEGGHTPIMLAAQNSSDTGVMDVLIEGGANVNEVYKSGRTPLMLAARDNNNSAIVEKLIDAGADVNRMDKEGYTARGYVQENSSLRNSTAADRLDRMTKVAEFHGDIFDVIRKGSLEQLQAAIEGDAELNEYKTFNYIAHTPLTYAAYIGAGPEVFRTLIEGGANVSLEAMHHIETTVLHVAAKYNSHPEVIRILLKAGANIEKTNDRWESPIILAAENSNPAILRTLIEAGAKTDFSDRREKTPLWRAGEKGRAEHVEILIDAGVDPDTFIDFGHYKLSPFQNAVRKSKDLKVIQAFLDGGADIFSNVGYANWIEDFDTLEAIQENDSLKNTYIRRAIEDWWRLYRLIDKGTVQQIKSEVGSGTHINWRYNAEGEGTFNDPVSDDETLLMKVARERSEPEIYRIFVEAGADVNIRNKHDQTALMLAAENSKNPEVLRILIDAGADVKARDYEGYDAWAYIQENLALRDTDVFQELMDRQFGSKTARVTRISASSALTGSGPRDRYGVYKVMDGDPTTCWIADGSGGSKGESLTVTLNRPITAEAIKLMPGYYDPEYYYSYSRIRALKINVDSDRLKYSPPPFADVMKIQRYDFPGAATFQTIQFIIDEVYEGDDYDNPCISELSFLIEGEVIPIEVTR